MMPRPPSPLDLGMLARVPTDLQELDGLLTTQSYGRAWRHKAVTGSTNDDAAAWLAEGGPSGLLVTADAQREGRGRQGRQWDSSAPEDLYASLGLRLSPAPTCMGATALAVGVGILFGVAQAAPALDEGLSLKWPNDLVLHGRKLAGILCESRWMGTTVELVIGFGLNVGRTDFTGPLGETATSLAMHMPQPPGRGTLLAEILGALEEVCGRYLRGGFQAIRGDYEPRCGTLGARVTVPVTRPDGRVERIHATALSLDPDGALRVRSAGGGPPFRVDQADVWMAPPG